MSTHIVEVDLNGDRSTVTINGHPLTGVRALTIGTDPANPEGPVLVTITVPATVIAPKTTHSPAPPVQPVAAQRAAAPAAGSADQPETCENCARPLADEATQPGLKIGYAKYRQWLCATCRRTRSAA